MRREIRRPKSDIEAWLGGRPTTLLDEASIGPIAAATLIVEVGDSFRLTRGSSSRAG